MKHWYGMRRLVAAATVLSVVCVTAPDGAPGAPRPRRKPGKSQAAKNLPDLKTPEDKLRFLEMIRGSFPSIRGGTSRLSSNTRDEVLAALGALPEASHRVVSRDHIAAALEPLRREGREIVFTNGCFDILHAGHVRYLQAARRLGGALVVGLNDDASVRRLKGPERPINSELDRAELLASLACVDFVVLFGEDTPLELVRTVQPDVLVKGEDWREKGVVGADLVEARGGRVVLVPLLEGRSTSRLVERIRSKRDEAAGDAPAGDGA